MYSSTKLIVKSPIPIETELRLYNAVKRFAFKRFQDDGMNEKEVRESLRNIYGIGKKKKAKPKENEDEENEDEELEAKVGSKAVWINSWIVQSAVKDAKALYARFGDEKIVFGGKANQQRYVEGKITKEEYREKRLYQAATIIGEQKYGGNRLFDFDFENLKLTFKVSRKLHYEIEFEKPHRNEMETLLKLQELINENKVTITVTIARGYVCIGFDPSVLKVEKFPAPVKGRILSIDQNPEYIGIAVAQYGGNPEDEKGEYPEILYTGTIDLSSLVAKTGKASDSKESAYQHNKLRHETIEIAHDIDEMVKHWQCEKVVVEELSFKPKVDKGGNKIKSNREANRKNKNMWMRGLFTGKLEMLSELHGYGLVEVNAAYSSFCGNLVYGGPNTPDMVAAAIEIGRRGYIKYKKGCFYPSIDNTLIEEPWKQRLLESGTWVAAYKEANKAGLKYRFKLDDSVIHAVFSKFHKRRGISIYRFL